ncbi:MAG: hypothetical protein IPM18_00040 [Phycisphaerales bacterium]|nr:hypothetical protein [Phycisphaerales bacterium]
MPKELLIVRHSGLRVIPPAEVLSAIPSSEIALPRVDEQIDTTAFAAQIEQDDWGDQDGYLREQAARLLARPSVKVTLPFLLWAGGDPHVCRSRAMWATSDSVVIHEFDRDSNSWAWPRSEAQIAMETRGLPGLPPVTARGDAVVRVEVSASISDEDVREAVGDNLLTNVRVVMETGLTPAICRGAI